MNNLPLRPVTATLHGNDTFHRLSRWAGLIRGLIDSGKALHLPGGVLAIRPECVPTLTEDQIAALLSRDAVIYQPPITLAAHLEHP
ncbi:hypothetical protein [Deinococcus sp. PEB2-67]